MLERKISHEQVLRVLNRRQTGSGSERSRYLRGVKYVMQDIKPSHYQRFSTMHSVHASVR